MSLKANYFKLGLFVIGAIVAGVILLIVIGSGRWFQPKLTIETYFNESVQGLDIGSKLKYRGVAIGEVTKIGFTYNKYQLDRPMAQRARFVLVEAQIEPKLLGGRAATGDLTSEDEREAGSRAGPADAPRAAGHHRHQLPRDRLRRPAAAAAAEFDWKPDNVYIPSAPSTVTTFVNAASEIIDRLHKLDIEGTLANLNKLMVTTNARIDAIDTKALSERSDARAGKVEGTLDSIDAKKLSDEGVALLAELRASNAELKKMLANPALQKLPDDAGAAMARDQGDRLRSEAREDARQPRAHDDAPRPHPRRRRDRPRDDHREPAPDHRQPARPDRGDQALSGERVLRRAAAPAGAQAMMPPPTQRASATRP